MSSRLVRHAGVLLLAVVGLAAGASEPTAEEQAKQKRLAWFREAKFGLFIHWGLYAIPAGEWKGKPGSRHRRVDHEPRADPVSPSTSSSPAQFNPVKFDADAWVQTRRGRRHEVHRHHHQAPRRLRHVRLEGEPVQHRRRHAVQARLLKELAAACAKRGMRLGFYYSQAQDWHEPNGAGNTWDFGPTRRRTSTSTCATRPSRRCASC